MCSKYEGRARRRRERKPSLCVSVRCYPGAFEFATLSGGTSSARKRAEITRRVGTFTRFKCSS